MSKTKWETTQSGGEYRVVDKADGFLIARCGSGTGDKVKAEQICQYHNGWDELKQGLADYKEGCEGLKLSVLDLRQERDKLQQQRDDLLVACKALFLRVTMHYVNHEAICKLGEECPDKKALKLAEQVIAKCKKQGT
jgi:hypothetical protein